MKKISEILKTNNINNQYSFLLGMIYGWPIFTKDRKHIIAYSSYKKGSRSSSLLKKGIEIYYEEHKKKISNFLNNEFDVLLNSEIKNIYTINSKLCDGVSVILEFDYLIPDGVDLFNYVHGLIEKWLIEISLSNSNFIDIFMAGLMDARIFRFYG